MQKVVEIMKSILWKYDSELGIAYLCPNCKLFLCGGNSQTKCKCGQKVNWDDADNPKNEYKGRIKWN